MNYSDKLKDRRWQEKSAKIKERDKWKCQNHKCKSSLNSQLHVHHFLYWPNKEPWEYHDSDLITLCFECHALEKQKPFLYGELAQTMNNVGFLYSDYMVLSTMLYSQEHKEAILKMIRDF